MSRSEEVVPGMAEVIEARRKELGLSPGDFATASKVSPQGLMPVRAGYRRKYQDKIRLGVARALRWQPDAIDRLLRGEEPLPLDAVSEVAKVVEGVPEDELVGTLRGIRDLVDGMLGEINADD